jgi:citrate synthase
VSQHRQARYQQGQDQQGQQKQTGYETSIGASDENTISLLGHDLAADLLGQISFGELAFWLVAMRRPEPGELRLFEAVLVALADHGLTPSAIAARLTLAGAPEALQGALAAGLLGGGSRFLGVTEDCGRFLAGALAEHQGALPDTTGPDSTGPDSTGRDTTGPDSTGSDTTGRDTTGPDTTDGTAARWDEIARDAVRAVVAAHRFVPGLGHPTHKAGDPRTPVILRIAEAEGLRGPHLRLLEAVGRVHPAILGRTLPVNGAGVCGAALADLGFPVEVLRGFALLARTAGLLGHLAEEARRPVGLDICSDVETAARYIPPAG